MTSKEALERLLIIARPCAYEVREHRNSYCTMLENVIQQDLDRLGQLEKAIEILKENCCFRFSCCETEKEIQECIKRGEKPYLVEVGEDWFDLDDKEEYEILKRIFEND